MTMKLRLALLAIIIALCLKIPAGHSQEAVDVAKITCNQFLYGQVTDSRTLAAWLRGYYSGTRGKTLVDVTAVQKESQDLMDYCLSHPEIPVMDAMRDIIGANK